MKHIKTRDVTRDIKVLDRRANLADATRSTLTKTKETAEQQAEGDQAKGKAGNDPTAYAIDKAEQTAAATGKATRDAVAAMAKAAIAALKSLVTLIAAGGAVASAAAAVVVVVVVVIIIIIIICLVALIASSAFGIFLTGEDMGDNNPSLREVIAEINTEQAERIAHIRATAEHDDEFISGSPAPWKEVLAVYAGRITTSADAPIHLLANFGPIYCPVCYSRLCYAHQVQRNRIS
jgi:hypothetical protein